MAPTLVLTLKDIWSLPLLLVEMTCKGILPSRTLASRVPENSEKFLRTLLGMVFEARRRNRVGGAKKRRQTLPGSFCRHPAVFAGLLGKCFHFSTNGKTKIQFFRRIGARPPAWCSQHPVEPEQ
jgi:hypothetical protein